jgi:hypothetical protein
MKNSHIFFYREISLLFLKYIYEQNEQVSIRKDSFTVCMILFQTVFSTKIIIKKQKKNCKEVEKQE